MNEKFARTDEKRNRMVAAMETVHGDKIKTTSICECRTTERTHTHTKRPIERRKFGERAKEREKNKFIRVTNTMGNTAHTQKKRNIERRERATTKLEKL